MFSDAILHFKSNLLFRNRFHDRFKAWKYQMATSIKNSDLIDCSFDKLLYDKDIDICNMLMTSAQASEY